MESRPRPFYAVGQRKNPAEAGLARDQCRKLRGTCYTRAAGVAGIAVGGEILLAFFGGLLRLDAHGFGIITFAQCGWFLWLGYLQCRGHQAGTLMTASIC